MSQVGDTTALIIEQRGEFFISRYIDGPIYAFLGLRFALGQAPVEMPAIELLVPFQWPGAAAEVPDNEPLRASVLAQVQQGVAEANQEYKTHFRIAAIQFVAGYNPPRHTYAHMARKIIDYILDERNNARVGDYLGRLGFVVAIAKYPCPCCGQLRLKSAPPGTHEICAECGWQDDAVQFYDIDFEGGANEESLRQARRAYQASIGNALQAGSLEALVSPDRPRADRRQTLDETL